MSPRVRKAIRISAVVITATVAVAIVAGIFIARSQWFADYVRTRIIAAVEDATGGRTEIGSFAFNWQDLSAEVRSMICCNRSRNHPKSITARTTVANTHQAWLGGIDCCEIPASVPEKNHRPVEIPVLAGGRAGTQGGERPREAP